VVIGNKNYSAAGIPNVELADRDARIMREYLLKTFGFKPENIFFEENATFAKFNESFGSETKYQGKLFDWVKKGVSEIFIYYVGHGAPNHLFTHLALAPTYIWMGREKEARAEAAEVLRISPKFSVDYVAKTSPYKDQSELDKYIKALRKAGLKWETGTEGLTWKGRVYMILPFSMSIYWGVAMWAKRIDFCYVTWKWLGSKSCYMQTISAKIGAILEVFELVRGTIPAPLRT
jgi:hypothetical protein